MKIIARANSTGTDDSLLFPVVLEIRMTKEEADQLAARKLLSQGAIEDCFEECMGMFLTKGHRTVRQVEARRG